MDKDKKDDITLEDLMGLPPVEKAIDNQDEAENREESANGEPKELTDVINSEKKDINIDAGLLDEENSEEETEEETEDEDESRKGYEEQTKDKKLTENLDQMAEENKKDKNGDINIEVDEDLKQKVVGVIKKFKGNAQAIEQMRETNPEIYASTLEVINVMLDLARSLGLCGGEDEESTTITEGLSGPGEDELGKSMVLPTKRTTRHIPKPRRPIGAIDNKGREKTLNEQGDISWTDRKEGVVRNLKGKIGRRDDGR